MSYDPIGAYGLKISIVILTNHSMGIVNRLIDRLLPQISPERHELVFLDNNSTDGTLEYLMNIPFCNKKVLTVEKGTFSHSRTRMWGAEQCLGEIVAFFTDDVVPIPADFLAQLVKPVESGAAIASYGAHQIHPVDGDPIRAQRFNDWYVGRPDIIEPMAMDEWNRLSPVKRRYLCNFDNCASCYWRDVLLQTTFPDLPYGEDMGIAKQFLLHGYTIAMSKKALFYHWHRVTFNYHMKRMCIDQIVSYQLFDLVIMKHLYRYIYFTILQLGFYTLITPIRLKKDRLYWLWYNIKYIIADNTGRYIGSLDESKVSKYNIFLNYLLKLKNGFWTDVTARSIMRNKAV